MECSCYLLILGTTLNSDEGKMSMQRIDVEYRRDDEVEEEEMVG